MEKKKTVVKQKHNGEKPLRNKRSNLTDENGANNKEEIIIYFCWEVICLELQNVIKSVKEHHGFKNDQSHSEQSPCKNFIFEQFMKNGTFFVFTVNSESF
jgi:hypothetical protein